MGKYTAARDLDLSVKKRWYVVANRTDAVFYKDTRDHKFAFVERLGNPAGKLTEMELDSDKPGRGFSSASNGSIHHSLDRRSHRHEKVAKDFARKIADSLEEAFKGDHMNEVVLVAESHFLGLIREVLPLAVRKLVKHEVNREYVQGSDQELHRLILKAIESE